MPVGAVGLISVMLLLVPPPLDWPPPPDFDAPVNYFAWHAKFVAIDDPPSQSALDLYLAMSQSLLVDRDAASLAKPDPMQFPAPNGPLWEESPPLRPWSLGENSQWDRAALTNEPFQQRIKEAFSRPFVLVPESQLGSIEEYGFAASSIGVPLALASRQSELATIVLQDAWRMRSGKVDAGRLLEACRSVFRLAAQRERNGDALAYLNAVRLANRACESLEAAIERGVFDVSDRAACCSLLSDEFRRPIRLWRIAAFDAAVTADLAQRAYAARRLQLNSTWRDYQKSLIREGMTEDRFAREYDRYYRECAGALTLPLTPAKCERLRALYAALRASSCARVYATVEFTKSAQYVAAARSRVGGLRLAVAAMVFKDRNARWPESAAELSKVGLLDDAPDPLGGNQLVYRIESGQPLVYSCGLDGRDNGGNTSERKTTDSSDPRGEDTIFWPPSRQVK